ncbi:hypothetical protein SAMN02745135_00067 [Caloranaerobacter azorensis DSM 13643]|uniref:Uncharacterized protein n=1 Tax=Caloranaerobacter azorensis DSM 13643 TaxID=1121264 RepID=A0A1M5R4F2_9FIRM|nr:hypothetical protein [Caloranaerobacter azorensis]SHH20910.1 hypothetical protein SAMN02745135_00067 [Caloranaerobacter azorensis DSM 13643]
MEIVKIEIPDKNKENFIKLYMTIYVNIIRYIAIPLYLIYGIILIINKNSKLIILNPHLVTNIGILLILFPISLALEETFHAAILIIQGRKEEVKALVFNVISIKKIVVLGIGVSVYFKGKFSNNDILYISLAGPVMSLVIGILNIIIAIIILLFLNINAVYFYSYIKILIIGFLFLPIFSLIPITFFGITTDGYKVLKMIKKFNISINNINRCILNIIINSFMYMI